MKYYILFGPPGAGKGTQAKLMVDKFNLHHVSTGDLLRKEIEKGTPIGIKAKALIDVGNFVDDETVIQMIEDEITNHPFVKGFLFDGFPRTTQQAEALDLMLDKKGCKVNKVISFIISDNLVFERIKHRASVEDRKDDVQPSIIQHRIDTYHKRTEPLIDYYKKANKYYQINGEGEINEIFSKVSELL